MHIWCISKYASTPNYGAAARLFYLVKEFRKLKHDAVLITSDANHFMHFPQTKKRYNFEEIEGVPVHWIKTKKYKRTASISRVLSWFDFEWKLFFFPKEKLHRPDVVLVSSLSILSILYGYFLKRKYQAFLVFEVRDIWPLTMTEEGGFSRWHPLVLLLGWVEKFGYRKADLIVGTMPKLDLHIKNILGYEKPFFCSPLGFDMDSYREEIEVDNPYEKNFPEHKIIVGYAGSMGISNGLESFIGAIEMLQENDDIYFVLMGDGDLKERYEKRLSSCSNVMFLPRVKQAEVKYFLKRCDMVYLSTHNSKIWEYGQSMNKVVEYMLAGKPIIASYSGYPSMINEAQCGFFVKTNSPDEVKQAILKVAALPPSEREEMGRRGREWIVKQRSYALLAKKYIEAIESWRENGSC